ncbi:hypothetical protein BDR06DRAFT_520360 [Suillus hirtellus]|nr:hypothetical protein BDR06DRAFT_520360 [Suillus hirtellus]
MGGDERGKDNYASRHNDALLAEFAGCTAAMWSYLFFLLMYLYGCGKGLLKLRPKDPSTLYFVLAAFLFLPSLSISSYFHIYFLL